MTLNRKLLAASVLLCICASSFAQDYPVRPIRMILGFAPGGSTDLVARVVAAKMTESWGHQAVVDNRPGANGMIGADLVAKANPDGYSLLLSSIGPMAINASLYKMPYDIVADFAPITYTGNVTNLLVVHPTVPVTNVKELIALAKAQPGKLTFGSSGTGSLTHMVVELLSVVAAVNFTHVPYKGVTGAYTDVIGGRIDFLADSPASMMPQVRGGRMRGLVVTAPKRLPTFPGVPTVAELGMADAEADFTTGLLAPPGTPAPVFARLQAESLKVAQSPEFHAYLATQGYEPLAADGAAFGKVIKEGLAKWERVVRERNIKVE